MRDLGCIAAVLLVALAGVARPQCFTENDDLSIQPTDDLSPITEFGIDLFKELYPYDTTSQNFFFSPYRYKKKQ